MTANCDTREKLAFVRPGVCVRLTFLTVAVACVLCAAAINPAMADVLTITSITGPGAPLGDGWLQFSTGGFIPDFCFAEITAHTISFRLSDGTVDSFEAGTSPQCQVVNPMEFGTLTFIARPGSSGTLIPLVPADFVFPALVGPGMLLDLNFFNPIDPLALRFTTATGQVFDVQDWRTFAPVPEPSTLLLLTLGLAAALVRRGR